MRAQPCTHAVTHGTCDNGALSMCLSHHTGQRASRRKNAVRKAGKARDVTVPLLRCGHFSLSLSLSHANTRTFCTDTHTRRHTWSTYSIVYNQPWATSFVLFSPRLPLIPVISTFASVLKQCRVCGDQHGSAFSCYLSCSYRCSAGVLAVNAACLEVSVRAITDRVSRLERFRSRCTARMPFLRAT